jgi:branched-chain amino acid transport system substrate-binding protein
MNTEKNFDELPDSLSAAAYSAGILVGEAIKKANSAERRDIQMELMNLKMMTPFGFYKVDERGYQIGHKMIITQIQHGKKVIVSPEEFATSRAKLPF